MPSEISNRKQLAERLESVMTKAYYDLKGELNLARNHSLVKTYLLEAHTSANSSHDEILKLIAATFQEHRGGRSRLDCSVSSTEDENLFNVTGSSRAGQFSFHIDTTNKRFWIAHSISKSEGSDFAIESVLNGNMKLDSAWMPMELLEAILRSGVSRGLALDFDRRFLDTPAKKGRKNIVSPSEAAARERETNPISAKNHLEYVKMQLWGEGADRILKALKEANLTNSTTISKVRLRTEAEDDHEQFSLADVKFDGKITGRGTSYVIYNSLLLRVLDLYGGAIVKAENSFRLHWEAESGRAKSFGQPFYVRLGEEGISNLEHFCAKVFSGSEPFRLMGLPVRRNANFYTVSAIDLHVNQRIDFEVSRKTITVFLPHKACGNSLLRLYTNLQHFFSSDVRAIDGSGSAVFDFQSEDS